MRARTSEHAEACLHHQPRPSHAKGAMPRPASQPRAAVSLDLLLALRRRSAGLLTGACPSLRSSNRDRGVLSAGPGLRCAARPVKGTRVARAFERA